MSPCAATTPPTTSGLTAIQQTPRRPSVGSNNNVINVRREQPILFIQPWSHFLFLYSNLFGFFGGGGGGSCSCLSTLCCVTAQDEEVAVRQSAALSRTWRGGELGLLLVAFRCCFWNSRPRPSRWSDRRLPHRRWLALLCVVVTRLRRPKTRGRQAAALSSLFLFNEIRMWWPLDRKWPTGLDSTDWLWSL